VIIMKEFVLRARRATTDPGFDLENLPKEGKLDSVCSAIANTLWISGDVRRDTAIHVVLEGPHISPKTISFFGNEIKGLRHDERSIALYIKQALQKGAYLELNEEANVRTGIKIAKKSFERLLFEKSKKKIMILDKEGKDIRTFNFPDDFVLVFGSPEGLAPKTEKFLFDMKAEKISLGPRMLFAAHCPIVVHNEIDRAAKRSSP
jgi:tRNA (pseudouridine54-N1)-methyltransferase